MSKNIKRGIELLETAANHGVIQAQYTLGQFYRDTDDECKDITLAAAWFKQSSDGGLPDAQADFAICLAEGKGVEQDAVEAFRLCILAANSGLERASYLIEMLESRMSQEDIQEARNKAGAN